MRRLALFVAFLVAVFAVLGMLTWAGSTRFDESKPMVVFSSGGAPGIRVNVLGSARDRHSLGKRSDSSNQPGVRASGAASVYTTTTRILTYPFADCLLPPQTGVAGVSYRPIDWDCLSVARPPMLQTFGMVVLSNDYLTVTLLPELGGRVYELIFKPTGHNELYRNPVLKPTPWGPPEQGWWLAAGGIEWGFPTDEHGYEWGTPWGYQVVNTASGVTVTLQDSAVVTRPTVAVAVHVPVDRAALVIKPKISNPTDIAEGIKYWANAMLAPGASNAPTADLRFQFPTEQVIVHSTGDASLPLAGELMDWPVYNGRDLRRLGNWDQWLGFFEAPRAHGPYSGVYDTVAEEGMLRVYPAAVAEGSKGFAFGWNDPMDSGLWTDNGSAYVEVQGGLAPTFWDEVALSPGQVVSWTEIWYPVAGLGGISAANEEAAFWLERVGDRLHLGLYTPTPREGVDLYLWRDDCTALGHWRVSEVGPAHPAVTSMSAFGLIPDTLSLVALSDGGDLLGGVNTRDCLPPQATIEPLPLFVTTPTFTVTWRGEDQWSGVADYDVQVRVGYDGDWTDWLTRTVAVSATFSGEDGQTYFFRARARDVADNAGGYTEDEWGQSFSSVLLTPAPVLVTSRKLANPRMPAINQTVTYTVILSNTGNLTAVGVALTDHMPATLALVSGTLYAGGESLPNPSGDVITWYGALTQYQEFWLVYALTATASTPLGVPLTNTLGLAAEDIAPLVRQSAIVFFRRVYLPLMTQNPIARKSVVFGDQAPP